jgi:hypothetical protein
MLAEAPTPQPNLIKSFGDHAFEGEGDAFSREKRCTPIRYGRIAFVSATHDTT